MSHCGQDIKNKPIGIRSCFRITGNIGLSRLCVKVITEGIMLFAFHEIFSDVTGPVENAQSGFCAPHSIWLT